MKWIKSYFEEQGLENQLFLMTLIIAIPYFISSIIFDLQSLENYVFLTIDSTFFTICVVMILLNKVEQLRNLLVSIFCSFILVGFAFYWISSGGMDGGGTYIFPVISILIILITKGRATVIFCVILILMAILAPQDFIPVSGETTYKGLLFDFILNLFMLMAILIFFKRSLDKEHEKLISSNAAVQALNRELAIRTTELELYNRDVEASRKNLERKEKEHFISLEKENEKIIEYAFINAHLLRAPLVNIIGLTALIESKTEEVQSLESSAKHLDRILHKISGVLHHQDQT